MEHYVCRDCGHVFSEYEMDYITEDFGECHGAPARQKIGVCPNCGSSDHEDGYECPRCGRIYPTSEMEGELCDDCKKGLINTYIQDAGACCEITKSEEEEIKLPALIVEALSKNKIIEVLIDYMDEQHIGASCLLADGYDRDWFCEEAFKYEAACEWR